MFGFLNCNKPVGFTSRDVVNIVQGKLRRRRIKVGHCGTLDPLADGVLVVGIGPAAKLVPYVHETLKRYIGSFRLAAESPTGDLEFEPTLYPDHPDPTIDQIRTACDGMTGRITQTPPAYSAIKIDGKRAYDLARKGKEVQIPSRTVRIDAISVLEYRYPDLKLDITCGTGTYIRTVGTDLARGLGTVAVMTGQTRVAVGDFVIDEAWGIDAVRDGEIESMMVSPSIGVSHLPRVVFDDQECWRLANGQRLTYRTPEMPPDAPIESEHVAALATDGRLVAIMTEQDGAWRPKKVFPQDESM